MPHLCVISHACSRAVNRTCYDLLQAGGWRVSIITADSLPLAGKMVASDPPTAGGAAVQMLALDSMNARRYRFAGLEHVLQKLKPDVVVCDNDPQSLMGVDLANWKTRLNYRLAFISCENLAFDFLSLSKRRGLRGAALAVFLRYCQWRVKAKTDLVFVINNAGLRLFQKAGFRRVQKTPLGFPEPFFQRDALVRAAVRAELGIAQGLPVVAYFGRLTPEKGVHLALDALETILREQPHIDFRFLIDEFQSLDAYQQQLRDRLGQAIWQQKVHWIHAKHGEVARMMNASDIVLLPSISTPQWVEQYGRVAPEAMACGALVIAARSGALPELVAEAGLLFEEGSAKQLHAQLLPAVQNLTQFAELRNAGHLRSQQFFSASAQATLWDRLLRQLLQ
jgi:glycosyltransferase involved in cell wall biosynthesis